MVSGTMRNPIGTRLISKGTVPILTLALTLLVSACGFHLQGRQPLPPVFQYTYIDTKDEQTDFVQDLRKALIASNVNVIRTKGSSGATISVHADELAERILSVSARNIPTEYELTYKVEFSVTSADKVLIDHEEISATRDISFDESQLLAKEREQEILREALARDLVALVMRRLAALPASP
jgi:LPS-assembly lipoprotein